MHILRTSGTMASLCRASPDPELVSLIGPYAAALEEFGENLAAVVLIVEQGDTLAQIEEAYGKRLVADGQFDFVLERAEEHNKYIEIVYLASDDGGGLVMLIDKDGDPDLLAASRSAIALGGDFP